MKFKGTLSLILAVCMLFSLQCISVFANDEEEVINTVSLFAAWNDFEGEEMTTEDNNNFILNVQLDPGSYQFSLNENDTELSHPTTINNTTSLISAFGIVMSDNVDARCTLLAAGGHYTFKYNVENRSLIISKDGAKTPAHGGENLTVKANGTNATLSKGDKFTYKVYLNADKAFEDIQAVLNFDNSKLSLTATDAAKCCPSLTDTYLNTNIQSLVAINAISVDGYNFETEKVLLTLDFTVIGTGEAYLDFIVQDMTILGGENSYYFLSCADTPGAIFRYEIVNNTPVVPDTSVTPTIPTTPDPTESQPAESQPAESQTTDATTPTETVPTTTTDSSYDEITTAATEPSETISTNPVLQYEMGDVNRDGKLNIKDATAIQKFLAKITGFDYEQMTLADYLADGKVNIKDATQIQKKLANLF